MNVLVIGAGVTGLTTALTLAEAGHSVQITAERQPADTTSSVAAAMWYPYRAYPQDRVLEWSRVGLAKLGELADGGDLRIKRASCLEIFPTATDDPWWVDAAHGYRRADDAELPDGYVDGYWLDTVVIEAPSYLQWLVSEINRYGVAIDSAHVEALDDVSEPGRLVVNCTGLGARKLVGDHEVFPIRGQVVRLANPGIDRVLLQEHGPRDLAYIIPRFDDVVCGGTVEDGAWDEVVDTATIERILSDCLALEPALEGCPVLGTAAGLRPGRSTVRLELDRSFPGPVIHNYGHGGSGYSLSWGCASEVALLASEV